MPSYIGLYTEPHDSHLERIQVELRRRRISFVQFDRADFPRNLQLTARLAPSSKKRYAYTGSFLYEQRRYWLEDMTSVLYRRPSISYRLIDGLTSEEVEFAQAEAKRGFDGVLRSLPCLWVNHPDALQAAEWKPGQLVVAQDVGFRTPQTLITSEPAEALQFLEECGGQLIYKPLSSSPTIRSDSDSQWSTIYTTQMTRTVLHQLAPKIAHTAHLFQEEIKKEFELRVNVFGSAVFATTLFSQRKPRTRLDWRRCYDELEYGVYTLPEHIQTFCLNLLAHLQLRFAAIDLAVTPDGEYVFFELNSNGQWMWIELMTGQPLTEAMVDLLSRGAR